ALSRIATRPATALAPARTLEAADAGCGLHRHRRPAGRVGDARGARPAHPGRDRIPYALRRLLPSLRRGPAQPHGAAAIVALPSTRANDPGADPRAGRRIAGRRRGACEAPAAWRRYHAFLAAATRRFAARKLEGACRRTSPAARRPCGRGKESRAGVAGFPCTAIAAAA